MFSLSKAKQHPNEHIENFRSRIESLVARSYHHLSPKDREPMAVNAFLVGLSDPKLIEHLLTQGPKTVSDAERIAVEYFQLRKTLAQAGKIKMSSRMKTPSSMLVRNQRTEMIR